MVNAGGGGPSSNEEAHALLFTSALILQLKREHDIWAPLNTVAERRKLS